MADLDAPIRAKIADLDYWPHESHPAKRDAGPLADALRAVLAECDEAETACCDAISTDLVRAAIARALGIDPDPCPYTHSHTRAFCGRPSCRES
ncbi:hypothetical protein HUO13_11940 [Saccharopolyspora erythraea]|uniref:hypothetical protein n=1 Tax=Saccharopolyspora erythraea TaxID=1836 RepID=UPI001BAE3672|nr:hypothetical protein [Saccharopolyspora erythraea]QUH01426.1 hypothetical protein HUO13_11940 [Saccharopolyspora erythraea]